MTAASIDVNHVVISVEKLTKKLGAGRDVVILEVWRDGPGDGQDRLPGARTVTLSTDLVGPRTADSGNLPLPTPEQIQEAVRRWGVNNGSIVVAYSPENPALAARAWWTLKWAGVPDVRVLDGGPSEWVDAGGELAAGTAAPVAGDFTVRTGSLPVLDAEQASALARSGALLDARNIDAYTGTSGGGHIPGAHSLPAGELVDPAGRLHPDEELRDRYAAVGADSTAPVGAYCGGGTSATLTVLALAKLGITAALYPGSFSAYSADAQRPVATGAQAG
jgi:thiosulfate/3-mercaptopyruvate sulfurtransferase